MCLRNLHVISIFDYLQLPLGATTVEGVFLEQQKWPLKKIVNAMLIIAGYLQGPFYRRGQQMEVLIWRTSGIASKVKGFIILIPASEAQAKESIDKVDKAFKETSRPPNQHTYKQGCQGHQTKPTSQDVETENSRKQLDGLQNSRRKPISQRSVVESAQRRRSTRPPAWTGHPVW